MCNVTNPAHVGNPGTFVKKGGFRYKGRVRSTLKTHYFILKIHVQFAVNLF